MKIGLLGCGAMGSLYGGYLSKVHEVYVCDVWKEHIEAIRANGIRLDEPEGETAVFTPKYATTDPSEIGPVDLLIVFVKYMLLEDALKNAKTMIGKDTIVLSLQNGIGNYDEIAKVVPEEQICCGTTAHGCTFLEPDRLAEELREENPVAIIENDCVITTGETLLKAFDRLEVMEYSAKSVIDAASLGGIVKISSAEVDDIEDAFGLH